MKSRRKQYDSGNSQKPLRASLRRVGSFGVSGTPKLPSARLSGSRDSFEALLTVNCPPCRSHRSGSIFQWDPRNVSDVCGTPPPEGPPLGGVAPGVAGPPPECTAAPATLVSEQGWAPVSGVLLDARCSTAAKVDSTALSGRPHVSEPPSAFRRYPSTRICRARRTCFSGNHPGRLFARGARHAGRCCSRGGRGLAGCARRLNREHMGANWVPIRCIEARGKNLSY